VFDVWSTDLVGGPEDSGTEIAGSRADIMEFFRSSSSISIPFEVLLLSSTAGFSTPNVVCRITVNQRTNYIVDDTPQKWYANHQMIQH
jgi:hypothetical protein